MSAHRVILLLACLGLGACGQESGEMPLPAGKKAFPPLAMRYEGRSLASWKAVGAEAPAGERAALAWALAALEMQPAQAVETLLRLLRDPDPSVRLAAVVACGRLAPASGALAAPLVALLEAPQEPLRRHARRALTALGAEAVASLSAALTHPRARVRWGALASLAGIGARAVPAATTVARLAREDPDRDVRRQALLALPHLGPPGVDACLVFLASADPDEQAEAAAALARVGAPVVKKVADRLTDEDYLLAAQAAGVLADLGPLAEPVLPALLAALSRAGPIRFNAAEALIAIGAPSVEPLQALLASRDEGVVGIARYALGRLKGE